MITVVVEYPPSLPSPQASGIAATERRLMSTWYARTVQRDYHGTKTIAFTFTREQAAIFRDWWESWIERGGGWFAANWPILQTRGPVVLRFVGQPEWGLIGGNIHGQGYWRLSATVEIRSASAGDNLPTVEVLILTSRPYPIEAIDVLQSAISSSQFAVSPSIAYDEQLQVALTPEFFVRASVGVYDYLEELEVTLTPEFFVRSGTVPYGYNDQLQVALTPEFYAKDSIKYSLNDSLGVTLEPQFYAA